MPSSAVLARRVSAVVVGGCPAAGREGTPGTATATATALAAEAASTAAAMEAAEESGITTELVRRR